MDSDPFAAKNTHMAYHKSRHAGCKCVDHWLACVEVDDSEASDDESLVGSAPCYTIVAAQAQHTLVENAEEPDARRTKVSKVRSDCAMALPGRGQRISRAALDEARHAEAIEATAAVMAAVRSQRRRDLNARTAVRQAEAFEATAAVMAAMRSQRRRDLNACMAVPVTNRATGGVLSGSKRQREPRNPADHVPAASSKAMLDPDEALARLEQMLVLHNGTGSTASSE